METISSPISPEEKNILPITKIDSFTELNWIRLVGDSSEKVEMDDCYQIKNDEHDVVFTYGANPCVAGMFQTKDNKIYMFHSSGILLTDEQEELISQSKKGFVGGGKRTLKKYSSLFKDNNIQIVPQPSPIDNNDFNIVFVKKKNLEEDFGVYYCYAKN